MYHNFVEMDHLGVIAAMAVRICVDVHFRRFKFHNVV